MAWLRVLVMCAVVWPLVVSAQERARNVVLFLADAGGVPTIGAASLHGYGAPRQLFVQHMPHIALSDTTTASELVSDSAAGMTAIVTGQKTHNGVLAQSALAVRGKRDGETLKTILEYAEEHGLSTGIITNDALTGATPAALYAKSNERNATAAIFRQLFAPRFGDGPEIAIGPGRAAIGRALEAAGTDVATVAREGGRAVFDSLDAIGPETSRAVVLLDSGAFDPVKAIDSTLSVLARNPRGYFLMVEWDTHTDDVRRGLDNMVALDRAVARTARRVSADTLVLFTADHSFDLRIRGGQLGTPLLAGLDEETTRAAAEKRDSIRLATLRMEDGHTGEEVLVAAQGPGAERVRGYLANTDLFHVMMGAMGW